MPAADNSGSVGCGGGGLNSGSSDVSGGEGSSMAGGVPMEDDRASSPAQTAPIAAGPAAPSAFLKRVIGVDEDVANNNREDEEDEEETMEVGNDKENGDEEEVDMDTSEKTSTNARNSNRSSSGVSEQLKEQLQTISSTINQGRIRLNTFSQLSQLPQVSSHIVLK